MNFIALVGVVTNKSYALMQHPRLLINIRIFGSVAQ
jgi:hypothetical protein